MRWPWQRQETETVPEMDWDEEIQDEGQPDDGDEVGEDAPEFDEETQARIDAEVERRLAERKPDLAAEIDRALEKRLAAFQQQPSAQPVAAAQPAEPDDPEPEYNPYDKAEFVRWQEWKTRQDLNKALAPILAENARLKAMQTGVVVDRAMDRVGDAIREHAPYLEAMLEHPDFRPLLQEALSSQDASVAQDPLNIAGLAGLIAPRLDRSKLKPVAQPQAQPRDEQGRFAEADLHRQALPQASRSAGRAPEDAYSDEERYASRYLGMAAAEVQATAHESIQEWRAAKQRIAARNGRSGRR